MSKLMDHMTEELHVHPFMRNAYVMVDPDGEAGAMVEMVHLSPAQWGEDHIRIMDIRALRPRGGAELMAMLTMAADEAGAMLSLVAKPLPVAIPGASIKMTKAKLKKWYRDKFGFELKRKRGDEMVRYPTEHADDADQYPFIREAGEVYLPPRED